MKEKMNLSSELEYGYVHTILGKTLSELPNNIKFKKVMGSVLGIDSENITMIFNQSGDDVVVTYIIEDKDNRGVTTTYNEFNVEYYDYLMTDDIFKDFSCGNPYIHYSFTTCFT